MDFEEFHVELVTSKKLADELYSLCVNTNVEFFPLPEVTVDKIKDFIEDKRDNLIEVTVNDKTYLTLKADKESAMALLKMVQNANGEDFPLAALPVGNLREFVTGQRDNVARLKIRRNKDVQVRVKSEKPKEKEKVKRSETVNGSAGD